MSDNQSNGNHQSETPWTEQADRLYENGQINARQAAIMSGQMAVEHSVDDQNAQLELVTESHVPELGARRAAKLKDRPPANTGKAKSDRDKGASLAHKTPPEWTPHLTTVDKTSH